MLSLEVSAEGGGCARTRMRALPGPLFFLQGCLPHDEPQARGGKVRGVSQPHHQGYARGGKVILG